jgi:uncharacterized protein YndB with AHSA1/START domain
MSTHTEVSTDNPVITMTRFYAAPRSLVWQVMTEPVHVQHWWGGAGCRNPLCDMDVRPGGHWRQVTQLASGPELHLDFVFLDVDPPSRLLWQNAQPAQGRQGQPSARLELTLDELGVDTRWTLATRFDSMAERDTALAQGFIDPIEAGTELLGPYLDALGARALRLSMRPSAPPPSRRPGL